MRGSSEHVAGAPSPVRCVLHQANVQKDTTSVKHSRLWDKGGAADADMLRFTARDDWQLDQRLLPFDLAATAAHVRGLGRIGTLSEVEVATLVKELERLAEEVREGRFVLTEEHEDGHTAIEMELTARLGDAGKKVHLGRSRNDQVLVAMRLYELATLEHLDELALTAAGALLDLAKRETMTLLPGYTHLQRAVPSTVGYWAAAFAEGLADAAESIRGATRLCNRSPLGGAAGYGVNLPLDREGVAEDLGFACVALNPLASQTSRGIAEAVILSSVWHASAIIRRLAWDLSLFTTAEFGFVRLDEALTTGSSIMPQKKNPDVVELLRASCSIIEGAITELMSLVALPAGYHRDLQLTKAPTMRALEEARRALSLVPRVIVGMTFDRERMARAVSADMVATDRAVDLAVAGVPFRDAYARIAKEVGSAELPAGDAARVSLERRVSLGAPGNLGLDRLEARLSLLGSREPAKGSED